MRKLRQPSAAAIQNVDADEEIDDMPFLVKGAGKKSKKHAP